MSNLRNKLRNLVGDPEASFRAEPVESVPVDTAKPAPEPVVLVDEVSDEGLERLDESASSPPTPYGVMVSQEEKTWKIHLCKKLLEIIDLSRIKDLDDEDIRQQMRSNLAELMRQENVPLGRVARENIMTLVEQEVTGMGPLEPLLNDPTISDILVNGWDTVYIERFGKLEQTYVEFDDTEHLLNIINRIVSKVGRRIDEASPMVDARLQDGSRVNAIIPPLSLDAPALSIRRFPADMMRMQDLVDRGALNQQAYELLEAAAQGELNIVISGGTGSGKTTLMNAISAFIPENERIITIEDSAELQLQQAHVVRLETRQANSEGKGAVAQRELVRNCLRMRPDRIILGEVRGAEALDMLQAMDTGHDGSITTIHANKPRDALSRIENMVAMTGLGLPVQAVRHQIASAIDLVIQVERMEDGSRRLTSIEEISGMEGEVILMSEIFRFQREGKTPEGKIIGRFTATGIVPKFFTRMQERGINLSRDTFLPNTSQPDAMLMGSEELS